MKFGDLVRKLRRDKELSLRRFCAEMNLDPSNWSKIERAKCPPPGDSDVLLRWADFFELEGAERQMFLDAAAIARNEIPPDLAANDEIVAELPGLFQAARSGDLIEESLKDLLGAVRNLDSPK